MDTVLKRTLRRTSLAVALAGGLACYYPPHYYAWGPPPVAIVETLPPAPGPAYVWVGGYHHWDGAGYVWVPGRWVLPPRGYAAWVPGVWLARGRRWMWRPGYWR